MAQYIVIPPNLTMPLPTVFERTEVLFKRSEDSSFHSSSSDSELSTIDDTNAAVIIQTQKDQKVAAQRPQQQRPQQQSHKKQQISPSLRFLRNKVDQITEVDQSVYRMVQLRAHIGLFSCFDEDDTETLTTQIQKSKQIVSALTEEVRASVGQDAAQWVTMQRMLKKREHALSEAQQNGIMMESDPSFPALLQKQVHLQKLLMDTENTVCIPQNRD